jgi:ribonuclease D
MLPDALANLLKDEPITCRGSSVQGDITRLKKQFNNLTNAAVRIDCVHKIAQCRGVIPRGGRFGLADDSTEVLGQIWRRIYRVSDWDTSNLSNEQKLYAAKDVIYALRINARLQIPNISPRRKISSK